jgi:hypothetical protein
MKNNYHTSTEAIYDKWLKSTNVVTKWSYKQILISRAKSDDQLAVELLDKISDEGNKVLPLAAGNIDNHKPIRLFMNSRTFIMLDNNKHMLGEFFKQNDGIEIKVSEEHQMIMVEWRPM